MVSHPRVPEVGRMRSRLGDWVGMRERHAYSRKHSRLALRHQGLEPCDELRFARSTNFVRVSATSCAIMISRRFEPNKKENKKQTANAICFFIWLPLSGLARRAKVKGHVLTTTTGRSRTSRPSTLQTVC